MDLQRAYGLYLSYHYWLKDKPIPADLFMDLSALGIDVTVCEEEWAAGNYPRGDYIENKSELTPAVDDDDDVIEEEIPDGG